MTENVSNLSLHKVKQDILIVFPAREILIPENSNNLKASVNQAGLLTFINNVFSLQTPQYRGDSLIVGMTLRLE